MSHSSVIIINGMPCTGKTFLAAFLAKRLAVPLITKDGIKEALFEALGYSDLTWSRSLGKASFVLIYHFAEVELEAGRSIIIEGNFHAEAAGVEFGRLQRTYGFSALQILCTTEPAALLERFRERSVSDERHPGHLDAQLYDDFGATVDKGEWPPIPIEGELIRLDTTNFANIDYETLARRVAGFLAGE